MQINIILKVAFISLVLQIYACTSSSDQSSPPKAEKIEKELTIHQNTRIDNYFWFNDRNNPKVISYLEAENKYTDKIMHHTIPLQDKLYKEIISRIEQTDQTVPYKQNGYYYYERYEPGKDYPFHCRKKDKLDSPEEILLDVNKMAEGKGFTHLVGLAVSPDNKILAYGEDYISRRLYTIRFKNLENGELLPDKLLNTDGAVAWANDNKTVFYTKKDETLRPYKIYKHILGTNPKNDTEIYHEADSTFRVEVYKSKSSKYIMLYCESTLSTEYYYIDADNPDSPLRLIQKRKNNLEYHPYHLGNKFYIRTNLEASNFKIVAASVNKSSKKNWKDILPHRSDVLVEDIDIFNDYYVVDERQNGLSRLHIKSWDNKSDYFIDMEEPTYFLAIGDNYEINTPFVRYEYSSLTTPKTIFQYNMKNKTRELLKQEKSGDAYNPENYKSERIFATADDGTQIPISLVYKKSLKSECGNPLLLYAYGSYGYSVSAYYKSSIISLLDRGLVYAIAHVRGGQEMGRQWYEDGKLLNKKNTFTDFIACADHLINLKYTSPDKLFARGGSAGGLLVGAVSNMRGDLFKGIIAHVPWVDVVTTMLDASIPLTSSEYDEWGDPNNKEYYQYMLSYSPYDNVESKEYPAMLVTTGLNDSQVQYWEPAKWVAKLRDLKTDKNVLLLKTDMKSGHGGASGRFKQHKETAFEFAFILDQLGITQ